MILLRSALVLVVTSLVACDTPCPAGHDPRSDPEDRACVSAPDCRIECVCADLADADERDSTVAGDCIGGSCISATDACRGACGERFAGEFCEP